MPSPMLKSNQNNCKQNSPRIILLLVGGTRYFGQAMDWCLLVVGEYKLYHSVWEPPIMCVAWKISRSLGCYVDNESMPLKILFISVLKLELWHLCKSLLPSAKGLSIYFYVVSPPSKTSAETEQSTVVMIYALCIANVGCIMTGSFLPWITMFSCCLNFGGALHLCFAVSERASEIPLLSYYIMIVLTTCCHLRYLIIPTSWLCHWYESL